MSKFSMVMALIFPLMIIAEGLSSAKTLEDLLREKKILTEEDLKQVTPQTQYRIGEGFTWTSGDERFRLNIGALMQLRYTYLDRDSDDTERGERDMNRFEARRLYWWSTGYAFTPQLTYRLQADFAGANVKAMDAFLLYAPRKEFQLWFGQYVVPFGRQAMTPAGRLQFMDRSDATVVFTPFYDTGISVQGTFREGLIYYSAGTYNGTGQNNLRNTNERAYNGRIEINPLGVMPYKEADVDNVAKPYVSVGFSYFYNEIGKKVDASGKPVLETTVPGYAASGGWLGKTFSTAGFSIVEDLNIHEWEADLAAKWRGFSLQGEYFQARAEGEKSDAAVSAKGYYVQGGAFLIPEHLEAAARYSYVDPDTGEDEDTKKELLFGINYYFFKHALKLQADVGYIQQKNYQTRRASDDMQYRLQAQLIF